ncbi:MAG: class I SAM-dependent methyltransferase [Bacteroidales bacterium]
MDKTAEPDVLGRAMTDYFNGDDGATITVRLLPDIEETLPVSYLFRSWEQMPAGELHVLEHCRGRVLDVGAGAGSHALALQKAGCQVTAIDISPGAVAVMKKRGVQHVHCVDFFDFQQAPFDTMLFLMNGAGIAGDFDGLKRMLEHARKLLHPEGVIFMESTDILYFYEDEDGSVCLPLGDRYYGEMDYQMCYKNLEGQPFRWLFIDFDNLSAIAEACGLSAALFYKGEALNYMAALRRF